MLKRIALLGWGSLLWDKRPDFDDQHHEWLFDGPSLKLEFSRVSKTRLGALTLVLDPSHGALCTVAYSMSKRSDPEDAICDLQCREGTIRKNIGFAFLQGRKRQSRHQISLQIILDWMRRKTVDVVVWTDLESNFEEICGHPFSVEAAIKHVQALDPEAKAKSAEYVWRAPGFVRTPLQKALQAQPWFQRPLVNGPSRLKRIKLAQ
jgi:hypothetical protein